MLMETVIKDLKTLVNSIEIKYTKKAKQSETVDSLRNADEYLSVIMGTDVFDGYASFDSETITEAGLVEPKYTRAEIMSFVDDKYNIPYSERNSVMNVRRNNIINNFVEQNNYYRELNGLPNIGDADLFKLTEDDANKYGITLTDELSALYLHQYPDEVLYVLQHSGYIDKLLEKYPDKKYLKHMGYDKIDILTARNANNLSIIKISKDVPDNFYNQFVTVYEQNREYFMTTIYNQDYSTQYDMYDNFIGLCIMIMTIQRIISLAFKSGIERDFYDWQFIQNMYKMYNIPFVEDIPIEYHVTLMKNLNNLLRYKSTDKVLFDVCSLLGYERIKIFEYYLVKEHKLDNNERPIFIYKKETDEDGNTYYVENKEEMYNLYFQSVNMTERNTALALSDTSNRLDYDEVISNDPYWWEDIDLRKSKFYNEYNYIETKYISLNLMYKMTEMLFELTYAFNMIQDKKDSIADIHIQLPKVTNDDTFSLFDAVIFMVALVCKSNGLTGNIPSEGTTISHILGFDFDEEQIALIKQLILDNADKMDIDPLTGRPVLLKYFMNTEATTADAVNDLFINIREYNDYIIEKMYSSKNIDEYRLYKKIFNISMVKAANNKVFEIKTTDSDGNEIITQAKTYLEYLRYSKPMLADSVESSDPSSVSDMLEHVLSKINQDIKSLQYLYIIYDNDNPVVNSIVKLLRFFKSYTTDLTSFNIIYLFDSKYYNNIKLIGDIHATSASYEIQESLNNLYGDYIQSINKDVDIEPEVITFLEKFSNTISIQNDDDFRNIRDELVGLFRKEQINDKTDIIDSIAYSVSALKAYENQPFIDGGIYSETSSMNAVSALNQSEMVVSNATINTDNSRNSYDTLSSISIERAIKSDTKFMDKVFLNWAT